ncbi:vacuolar segregation subunit 7-domain-containing protein [Xylogone sp. PMI_703]|nr:vacuolar segregation subunit 7-domain-containing protein [Xylogone sp. PMI_703]
MEDRNAVTTTSSRSATDGLDAVIPRPDQKSTSSPALKPLNFDASFTSSPSTLRKPQPKRVASAASTPVASRESSPVRPYPPKSNSSSRLSGPGRTRKNSFTELSSSRNNNSNGNPPSTAGPQRTLSITSPPILSPTPSNPAIRSPVPQRPPPTSEIREVPRWPVSPRLRSPPPMNRPAAPPPRKSDQDIPAISIQQGTPPGDGGVRLATPSNDTEDAASTATVMRTAPRGIVGGSSTLETVQEVSQPGTPGPRGIDTLIENASRASSEQDTATENGTSKSVQRKPSLTTTNESGSDSGGKGEIKLRSTSAAPSTLRASNPPKSFSTTSVGRSKALGEGSTMTVETETVSSIPQVAVGVGAGGAGANGSLRAKPSSETIRPKKEKRRTRKPPSATSGTTSSKADFFEAKVASAVDEADSSDSEETFVYESNPPDANDRPRRFHSRTPSTTSMASQIDQRNGSRSMADSGQAVAVKKSMKFASTYTSNGEGNAGDDDAAGTIRASRGAGRGTTHHHHIGRWGRNGGNGHQSLFDEESPFSASTKSKSRPMSPRVGNPRLFGNGKKQSPISSGYDLDNGADDERTPLISTVRSSRSSRSRRQGGSSLRQLEHQAARQNRSCWSRFLGCFVLLLMIVLVISGALGFMFATTQPLTDVKILALKNVLASEQELIVDMEVLAQNPNLIMVTIDAMDVVVFAKSKYAGTDEEWWNRPKTWERRKRWGVHRRDDDPKDRPPEDDPATNPNLEIGHIYEFDSPLTFEGSPFKHSLATSTGEIRVSKPGNSTVPSGSERWGQVLQHEFELIVRGTLRYTLPLGQKIRSVGVEGRVTVKPNAADHDPTPGTVHTN